MKVYLSILISFLAVSISMKIKTTKMSDNQIEHTLGNLSKFAEGIFADST
jgi:hypothetical protein